MTSNAKPRRPSREQIAASCGRSVPDVIGPDLRILFVGINPSLYSAAVGHHFARPGNRFWPGLHASGLTDRQLTAFEDRELLRYGCGVTNIVDRATARAAEVSNEELIVGATRLETKVARYRVRCVAFLGITAYRTAYDRPQAAIGRQPERIGGAAVWVLPNPSGLNAHYQLSDFARLFAELRDDSIG